jgi:hypothetical protein
MAAYGIGTLPPTVVSGFDACACSQFVFRKAVVAS